MVYKVASSIVMSGMGDLIDIGNCYTAGQEGNQDISRVKKKWKGGFGGNVLVKTFIAECRTRYKIQGIFILKHLVAKHFFFFFSLDNGLASIYSE